MRPYPESREIKELVDSERWEEAKARLELLASKQNDSAMLNDLALIYARLGERKKAVEVIEQAKALDDDVRIWINHYFLTELSKWGCERGENALKRIKELKVGDPNLKPKLSIIMRTYNRGQLIEKSIRSVLNQKFQDWELVIANDGGSRDVEKTLEKLWDKRMVYAYAEHSGPAGVFNVGLRLARGKYIGFLDDDDIIYPEHWERMVNYLDRYPEVKVLYSDLNLRWLRRNGKLKNKAHLAKEYRAQKLKTEFYIMQLMAIVFRKEGLEKAIGFLEDLRSSVDWEFVIRLSEGFEFEYLPGFAGEWYGREGSEQVGKRPAVDRLLQNNLILYYYGASPFFSWGIRNHLPSEKFLRVLKEFCNRFPEMVPGLSLRSIHHRREFHLFYQLAKELEKGNQLPKAMTAYRFALSLSAFMPKIWHKIIRVWIKFRKN